jgi:O-antigen ligase
VYLALVACVFARRMEAARWLIGAVVLAAARGTVISAVRFYSVAAWPLRLEYASAIYNANEGATAAGSALLLAVFWLAPTSDSRWQRALWLACATTLLAGMVLSGSRTPLVAVVVSLLLGLALRRQWRLLVLAVALCGVTVSAGIHSSAGRQALLRGDSYRLAIWQYYANRAAQHPWFGEGVLTDDTSRVEFHGADGTTFAALHPHDVYLATTLYGGLVALILLLSAIALAIREGCSATRRGEPAWLLVLLFGLLCMLTDGDRLLHAPRAIWVYFWLPIGVLIGLALARTRARSPPPSAWPTAPYRSE